MNSRMRAAVFAIILLAMSALSVLGEFLPPVVTVRKVGGASDVLKVPPVVSRFTNLRNKGLPTQQAQLRIAYDDAHLYLAFRCLETELGGINTNSAKHDDPVWRDDSVEVFLDPTSDGKTFLHLVANARGVTFDCMGAIPELGPWDEKWTVRTSQNGDAWTAFASIPFASMSIGAPKAGDLWDGNFARHQVRLKEMSTWSPVIGQFAEPERFGEIVFGDAESVIASVAMPEVPTPGKYPATVSLSNPRKTAVPLRVDVLVDGKAISQTRLSASPGESTREITVDYPLDGRHSLSIAIVDSKTNKVVSRTAPADLSIAPDQTRLDRFREVARGLQTKSPALQKEIVQLKKSLGELVAFSQGAKGSADLWRVFGEKLDAVEPEVSRLRYMCSDPQERGYVIGTETPLVKVLRDKCFGGALNGTVSISAAKNEYEGAQVIVIPWKQPLEGVAVSVTPLKGSGAIIPADRIKLNLVEYVKTRKPRYDVDYIGWWPDPLMEMRPFDVAKGLLQPVWVTVHPAEDTPAGLYKGEVVIKPKNAPEARVPLEVRVWDFALPKTPALKTAFALFPHEIGAWYGEFTDDMRMDYYQFLLDHRINPTNIYSKAPAPTKSDVPFCAERGLNAFCLAYTHNKSEEDRGQLAAMIREHESYLKEKGWWDKAYIYGFDEILRDKYPELRDMYGWVKKEFPDLPRMCTVVPNEELKGYVDIWVPLTANYNIKDAQAYTKAGDEVWWYVCCNPHHPYPNFFIDYPAMDQRVIFWQTWKYRVPGFLYYAINLWQSNRSALESPGESRAHDDPRALAAIKAGKRWPEVPWNTYTFDDFNGDGVLIYPGPYRKPLSSIRFECIRDGIEDYDCLRMLSDLVDKAEKSGGKVDPALSAKAKRLLTVDEVTQSPSEYTLGPVVLLDARQEVAQTIEKLRKALGD